MDKYKRYLGVLIFILAVSVAIFVTFSILSPRYDAWSGKKSELQNTQQQLESKEQSRNNVVKKIQSLRESVMSSQKKVYTPVEDKLGNDTLFFTLYSDIIEMVQANKIKIKTIDYKYNPAGDPFVAQGATYFVCDVNLELVSNYVNLGKLIQDIYQYPYYIKINQLEVLPYPKDKKILLSTLSLRLYTHTSPEEDINAAVAESGATLEGATTPLP